MKHHLLAASLALSLAYPALAADRQTSQAPQPGQSRAAQSDGTVKKIDKAVGRLIVAHGPLENLGMPAMTMVFRVKDPAWLERVKEGDRIRFSAENVQGVLTIVRLEAQR